MSLVEARSDQTDAAYATPGGPTSPIQNRAGFEIRGCSMTQNLFLSDSFREFFSEAINAALHEYGMRPNQATQSYLIDLLVQFATFSTEQLDQPLGPVLAEAQTDAPKERASKLKRVGDHSLYLVGFFRGNIRRRNLDPEYYSSLGETAYHDLSDLVARQAPPTVGSLRRAS